MVARCKPASQNLVVTFERDDGESVRIVVVDGKRALLRAVATLIAYRELRAGDRLTVEAVE